VSVLQRQLSKGPTVVFRGSSHKERGHSNAAIVLDSDKYGSRTFPSLKRVTTYLTNPTVEPEEKMKIGRILHLKSRNPKNLKLDSQYLPRRLRQSNLKFRDFGI